MANRSMVTRAVGLTRSSESWPVYNVRGQCLGIAVTIVAIIAAIVLLALL